MKPLRGRRQREYQEGNEEDMEDEACPEPSTVNDPKINRALWRMPKILAVHLIPCVVLLVVALVLFPIDTTVTVHGKNQGRPFELPMIGLLIPPSIIASMVYGVVKDTKKLEAEQPNKHIPKSQLVFGHVVAVIGGVMFTAVQVVFFVGFALSAEG